MMQDQGKSNTMLNTGPEGTPSPISCEVPRCVAKQPTATAGAEGGWDEEGKVPGSRTRKNIEWAGLFKCLRFKIYIIFKTVGVFRGPELCLPWLPSQS